MCQSLEKFKSGISSLERKLYFLSWIATTTAFNCSTGLFSHCVVRAELWYYFVVQHVLCQRDDGDCVLVLMFELTPSWSLLVCLIVSAHILTLNISSQTRVESFLTSLDDSCHDKKWDPFSLFAFHLIIWFPIWTCCSFILNRVDNLMIKSLVKTCSWIGESFSEESPVISAILECLFESVVWYTCYNFKCLFFNSFEVAHFLKYSSDFALIIKSQLSKHTTQRMVLESHEKNRQLWRHGKENLQLLWGCNTRT